MKVVFWLFMSLDRHSTSGHLILAMIEQVIKRGNQVTVIHLNKLHDLKADVVNVAFNQPNKSNFAKRYFCELKYLSDSSKQLSSDADAVFIQSNIIAGFAVRKARKKCRNARITYNVQDGYPQDVMYAGKIGQYNPIYLSMVSVQKYAYKNSDSVITISEDMKDLICESNIPPEKVEVIYNWSYRDELFDKSCISPKIAKLFDNHFFNVVYAGNIGLFQNVGVVVDVAEKLKNNNEIKFHIFGNGIYKDNLQKRANKNEINNLIFHPIQPHELAPSIYASASINIIPLGKNQYRAALPSKTATCFACQNPIIFVIGKESKFGQKVNKETGCPLLDCDDVDGVVKSILEIKESGSTVNTADFYLEHCSITKNSLRYAMIILGEIK